MSPGATFVLLTALCIGALLLGVRFRTHRIELYITWYRNDSLPPIVRNVPIVVPFYSALILPCLLLLLPAALRLEVGMGWPVPAQKALAFGALAYFLFVNGVVGLLLTRLPAGLVPAW